MIGENLRKAPLIRVVIPFGAGIVLGTIFLKPLGINMLVLNSVVIFILLLIAYFVSKTPRFRWVFGLILLLSFSFLGIAFYTLCQIRLFSSTPGFHAGYCYIMLKEHIKSNDDWNVFYADYLAEKKDLSWSRKRVEIQVYISRKLKSINFLPGDRLVLSACATRTAAPTNPCEFNYQKFLDRKGVWGSVFIKSTSSICKVFPATHFSVVTYTYKLQDRFLSVFRRFDIKGDELALLSALTIGVRDQIDNEINKAFSASGAMHILSVSGLHVGIVYLVFARLLSLFGRNRFARILSLILQILFLWFYAFLTGLSPAVNRAAAMFSFLAIGNTLNRSASSLNIVAGSALVLLLFNPLLIFDMGFQLSYLAVISIVLFQPFISGLFEFKNYLVSQVWELTALSIAAQIGTFPLSIIYFHQFPNYFILTNLLVVPLAAIILYLAIAMVILYWIPWLSTLLAWLLKISLKGMIFSVMKIEHLPFSVCQNISINITQLLMLYLVILFFACFLHFRQKFFVFATVISIAFVILSMLFRDFATSGKQNFIVYNLRGSTMLMARNANNGVVFYSGNNPKLPAQAVNLSKGFSIEEKVNRLQFHCIDSLVDSKIGIIGGNIEFIRKGGILIIRNGAKHYMWINLSDFDEFEICDSVIPDILIAGKLSRKTELEKIRKIKFRRLVIDSSCRQSFTKDRLISDGKANSIIHVVSSSGAFVGSN